MTDRPHTPVRFARKDVAEIAIGACVMAFPVATTEEIWNLGQELTLLRVLIFAVASIFFLAVLIFLMHHEPGAVGNRRTFLQRVLSTYGLTLVIAALLLFGVDRFDFFTQPLVALKRCILVAFPASFAATVVDSIGG